MKSVESKDQAGGNSARQAIVIGAGMGGLAAAMRLGAKGYRVTVCDRLDVPGGRASYIRRQGHRFDLGPTIVTLPDLYRDLWSYCGYDFDQDVELRSLEPLYEIRWPDGAQFTAYQDETKMRAEVARFSPRDVRGYEQFLEDSRKRYAFGFEELGRRPMHRLRDLIAVLHHFVRLRADRSVAAHARRRFRDARLQMAFSFHPLFIGGDPFNVTSIYILVSHIERMFGIHYPIGGVAAIANAMTRVIGRQGGEIKYGAEVDEIIVNNGHARGVRLVDGTILNSDIVVSNADSGHTYKRLLHKIDDKRWSDERLSRSRWSMGLFIWYFGTRGTRALWPDVGHHTILNGPRYRGLIKDIFIRGHLADDMSLYIHRPSVTDPTVAPKDGDTFYALCPVPHLGFEKPIDWSVEAAAFTDRVKSVLEAQLLPGLSEYLTVSETFTPETFRDRYLSPYGSGFSIEPRIFQSAWFRPHNVSEDVAGLYLTGAGTHPGAGLPGVVSSAEVMSRLVPAAEALH